MYIATYLLRVYSNIRIYSYTYTHKHIHIHIYTFTHSIHGGTGGGREATGAGVGERRWNRGLDAEKRGEGGVCGGNVGGEGRNSWVFSHQCYTVCMPFYTIALHNMFSYAFTGPPIQILLILNFNLTKLFIL